MFWIPIMAIAVVIFGAMYGFEKLQSAVSTASINSSLERRRAFLDTYEADRELSWRASELEKNYQWKQEIVSEFMNDGDPDWKAFAIYSDIAKRVYFAQHGKILWTDSIGVNAPKCDGSGKYEISPPWKVIEMMERYMLRVEETLRENGVETTAVANYGSGYPTPLNYYPVREYVKKFGYARENYSHFGTEFSWSQCKMDVLPVPDK